jgi:queuine tRNA-ribosyltransferase
MKLHIEGRDGNARAGRLETSHGVVETPMFMPVGTYGSVKGIHPEVLRDLGAGVILCNAYHLYLSPGIEVIRTCGGIQSFTGWQGPILTDSGGYQVFSLRECLSIDDEGVRCRSPIDGSPHFLTPESVVEFQAEAGVDIAMMLDHCPPADADRETIVEAMNRTTEWARRGLSVDRPNETALFGIVQGGVDLELRAAHLAEIGALELDGLALGGLSVGEPPEVMHAVVDEIAPQMPTDRPRYLMGVGRPLDLVRGVAAGIDMFDCVMPTRHARNGQLFTSKGKVNVPNSRHRTNPDPPDPECGCPTCRRFSMAYLSHLYRRRELLYHQLATTHNLYYYSSLMRELREAILEQRIDEVAAAFGEAVDRR